MDEPTNPTAPTTSERAEVFTVEEQMLLTELAARTADIANEPEPASWQRHAIHRREILLRYGPEYRPGLWFGDGRLDDADAVRFRRAVLRLEARGLVRGTNSGGRLRYLRLTPAGRAAADGLTVPTEGARCDE